MPVFSYKAISDDGEEITDVMEADDETIVAERLDKLGYLPVKINKKSKVGEIQLFSKKKKIKEGEIIHFTKQLVTLLKAGVPLLGCLEAMVEQSTNEDMKDVIQGIYVDIESGLSFSDALQNNPDVFSELYICSIRAGEIGGALDNVMNRLSVLMEKDAEIRARIKAATRYPIIVVVSLVLAFVALMLLVVPNFIELFSQFNLELPIATRLLIGMYNGLTNYWYLMLGLLGAAFFGFKKYIKTENGALRWDNFKLRTPVFGDLNLKTAMSRFTRMFETLNSSGLPILQTLEITSKTVGNLIVGKEIDKISVGVLQGEGIAVPLTKGNIFPPMVVQMIAIGEKSGSLDEMLLNISDHYDTEVEYAVKNMTSMIEPVLTVAVGGIVLFLAIAIFLPMWDLTKIAQ